MVFWANTVVFWANTVVFWARKVYQGNRKVYHGARTQYQTIADMSVLVVSPGFSLVREILSEVNRWHQEHGLALWGKGHVKNIVLDGTASFPYKIQERYQDEATSAVLSDLPRPNTTVSAALSSDYSHSIQGLGTVPIHLVRL